MADLKRRHKWLMIRNEVQLLRLATCVRCLLARKQKKLSKWQTTYSEGWTSYRHVPPCEEDLLQHRWKEEDGRPWLRCSRCGSEQLTCILPGKEGPKTIVYQRADPKSEWVNEYTPCRNEGEKNLPAEPNRTCLWPTEKSDD